MSLDRGALQYTLILLSIIIRITSSKGVVIMSFGRRGFGPRTMHKIKCSDCGQDAEVPFLPQEGRPVYCRECFQKHRTNR